MCSSDTTGSRVSYELSFYSEAVVKCQCSFSCMRAPRVTRDCTTTENSLFVFDQENCAHGVRNATECWTNLESEQIYGEFGGLRFIVVCTFNWLLLGGLNYFCTLDTQRQGRSLKTIWNYMK